MIRKIMKQMDPNAQAEEAEVCVVTKRFHNFSVWWWWWWWQWL
jgi:hypothetical protein